MDLTKEERALLEGREGRAAKKAMEILVALGEIYGAKQLVEVRSVQIAGVSYDEGHIRVIHRHFVNRERMGVF